MLKYNNFIIIAPCGILFCNFVIKYYNNYSYNELNNNNNNIFIISLLNTSVKVNHTADLVNS